MIQFVIMPIPSPVAEDVAFGQWLKRRRQELDLTQDRLAELTGYAGPTIQKIERGERKPSRDLAKRLADVLAIPYDEREAFLRSARGPITPEPTTPTAEAKAKPVSLPLLLTHIQPPPLRRQLVARQRLSERIEYGYGGTITLVVAPAGWGKTTLLSMWIAGLPTADRRRVAWLALDHGETEPIRLLRYVIAALQQAAPGIGEAALAVLETPQPALEAALMLLLNNLAEQPHPLVLILDDYHVLRVPALHQILTFLVEHLPSQLHLIIASRENPPLPLSRLRARGQLHELRADDLRFTAEESADLLASMGLQLAPQAITALEQRLEGWAAGLQLTALALRDQHDQSSFIDGFIESHRLALDYLAEEVLEHLPNHVMTFLLQTSILDRLCGPLCDAVMGVREVVLVPGPRPLDPDSYSQLILEDLERANLFLIPLDETQMWYRYHHLFGALLRARLERGANPAMVRELHSRAANWHAAQQLWQEALAHAQHGQQWDIAAKALLAIGDDLMVGGAFERLSELIERLPEHVRAQHPRLLMLQGLCASKNYRQVEAYTLLSQAAALFEAQGDRTERSEALVHIADAQRSIGEFAAAYATLQEALSGPLPPLARMNGLISRSYEALAAGDWQAAQAARNAALSLASQHPDPRLQFELAINGHPSLFLILPGSVELAERFRRIAADWDVPALSPVRAMLLWVEGYTRLLGGDPAAAIERIDEALHISNQLGGLAKIDIDPGVQLVLIKVIVGDLEAANKQMASVLRLLEQPSVKDFTRQFGTMYGYIRGWLAIQQGRIAEAHDAAGEIERGAHAQEWPISPATRLLLRGLLAIEAGDSSTAQTQLQAAIAEQQRFADAMIIGDGRVALAYSLLQAGNERAAVDLFAKALDEHVQRGTPGVLLLSGPRYARPLLQLAHGSGLHVPIVERLLQALGTAPAISPVPALDGPDALTPREREVLQLLAQGAGNQAIASALIISLHTTKTHVARILDKLGAQNRTEAVVLARQRGLV